MTDQVEHLEQAIVLYYCEFCDYITLKTHDLTRHNYIHIGKTPFICTYDGYQHRSRSKYDLIIHNRTHQRETIFL